MSEQMIEDCNCDDNCDDPCPRHARENQLQNERDAAVSSLREMIEILEDNIKRRSGLVSPGGGNMHEAMLLYKWRKAALLEVTK